MYILNVENEDMYIDNLCQNQQAGEKAPFPQPFPYSV
jgi:hypothetical protein